jgi:hypothetical protein
MRAGQVGTNEAWEALAKRFGEIVLLDEHNGRGRVPAPEGKMVELPDGVDAFALMGGMRGDRAWQAAPGVWMIGPADEPPLQHPVVLGALRVTTLGDSGEYFLAPADLEHLLFVYESPIWLIFPPAITRYELFLYHWPSREGGGREVYVLKWSTASLYPKVIPTRGLVKYTIKPSAKTVELVEKWGCVIRGPVSDFEFDFDEDGVIDVVAREYVESQPADGEYDRVVIISGATGERLGEMPAVEIVVTRGPVGVRIRTMSYRSELHTVEGISGPLHVRVKMQRVYDFRDGSWELEEEHAVGWTDLGVSDKDELARIEDMMRRGEQVPIAKLGWPQASEDPILAAGAKHWVGREGKEEVLAHVATYELPGRTAWKNIRKLQFIGEEQRSELTETAAKRDKPRILFQYVPPRKSEENLY